MDENVDLSIVIVSFNTKNVLRDCIFSVIKNLKEISYEIIIVDNHSQDGSVKFIKRLAQERKNIRAFFMKDNLGFGKGNNFAMKKCVGKYILLLNSDTLIENNVIKMVFDRMESNSGYGVSSPNLFNIDGSIQGTGGYFPTLIRVFSWMTIQDIPFVDDIIKPFHPMRSNSLFKGSGFYSNEKDLDWVTGAFMMIRKETYDDVGGFDEDFFMYTEEVEYCMRIRENGWRIRYFPFRGVIHLGGASGKTGDNVLAEMESVKLLYRKHYPRWQYPVLRLLLKSGCLWRIPVFGFLKGKEAAKTYAQAFVGI